MSSHGSVQKVLAIGIAALALGGWAYGASLRGTIADLERDRTRAAEESRQLQADLHKARQESERLRTALERRPRNDPNPVTSRQGPPSLRELRDRKDVTIRYHDRDEDFDPVANDPRSLEELLASDRPRDREIAVDALADSGRPDALDLLAQSLGDLDEDVREAAIEGLAELGGDEAAVALAAALKDSEPWNRDEALDALIKIGGDAAARSLAVALQVNDQSLRVGAVEALGKIGGEEAVEVLTLALRDQDPKVRRAAAATLERLGEAAPLELPEPGPGQ